MEKAKYLPDEIDRLIDEEISRIDAANTMAAAAMEQRKSQRRSFLARTFCLFRGRFKRNGQPRS